jgi:hypothetical protein
MEIAYDIHPSNRSPKNEPNSFSVAPCPGPASGWQKTKRTQKWVAPSSTACGCFLQNKPNFLHFQIKNKDCSKKLSGAKSDIAMADKAKSNPKSDTATMKKRNEPKSWDEASSLQGQKCKTKPKLSRAKSAAVKADKPKSNPNGSLQQSS